MSRINPLSPASAQGEAAELYKTIKTQLGSVPNIFQALGNTPSVLKTYFGMGAAASSLSAAEKESIALAVAQVNSCGYCLAAHTAIGTKVGLTESEALQNRKGASNDSKRSALIKLAREIATERGHVSDQSFQSFIEAGYKPEQAAEVVLVVVQNIFTNYFNHVNKTPIDFPEVSKL